MREHDTVIKKQENNIAAKAKALEENNEDLSSDYHFICSKKLILAKRELFRVIVELEKAEHSERSIAGQLKNAHTVQNKGKILHLQTRLNRNIARLDNRFQLLKDQVYRLDQLTRSKIP